MKTSLLDVNVLVALWWPAHESHDLVQEWFDRGAGRNWATCPLTQEAFVRLVSNPAFSRDAVPPQEAVAVLEANVEHPGHHFWPDAISFWESVQPMIRQISGHQQVSDSYLLGLAIHHQGRLATLDRGVLSLLPSRHPQRSSVEVISAGS